MITFLRSLFRRKPQPKKLLTIKDHDAELQRLKAMNAHYKRTT